MKVVLGLVFGLIATPSIAQTPPPAEPPKMDAIDFTVDFKDLLKKRVTITGCQFGGANGHWVQCFASANRSVHVGVETKSLDKEDLRRALKECAGASEEKERCTGSVTGVAFDFMGLGAALQKAKIAWDKP